MFIKMTWTSLQFPSGTSEIFQIPSELDQQGAEDLCKETLSFYNEGLRPNEYARTFKSAEILSPDNPEVLHAYPLTQTDDDADIEDELEDEELEEVLFDDFEEEEDEDVE